MLYMLPNNLDLIVLHLLLKSNREHKEVNPEAERYAVKELNKTNSIKWRLGGRSKYRYCKGQIRASGPIKVKLGLKNRKSPG